MENIDAKKGRKGGKANKRKAPKRAQRSRYVFVRTVRRSALYSDYFSPDRTIEIRMMDLADVVRRRFPSIPRTS
jgi:hypothetical protein